MPTEAKVAKGTPVIGTHDGTFHCDEVLACWMLKQLPQYKDASIERTRDNDILGGCDVVVDVGGVYDPHKNRYDHHQRSFNGTMKSLHGGKWNTKLSSAGLIYLHKGKEVLSQITGDSMNDDDLQKLYDKVYEKFVEEIDAVDNGIDQYDFDGEPRYQVTTTLPQRVGGINPLWNEKHVDVKACFNRAMELVGLEFMDRVNYYKDSWFPARSLVDDAIQKRFEIDPSGEIIVFQDSGCPWKEHLFDIEKEKNIEPLIKFVLYPDQAHNWRVQCVPKRLGSFDNRLSLLEKWRGLRDDTLSSTSLIPSCIFVHANGFVGGNKTYDGALEMARKTLERGKQREE